MEDLATPTGIIGILILILIILAILMPVFVYQISNYTLKIKKEIITLNESISLLNDNIIVIGKNSAILVEIMQRDKLPKEGRIVETQQGVSVSQCSWCQKTFPSYQAKIFKHVTLCPDCAKESTETP